MRSTLGRKFSMNTSIRIHIVGLFSWAVCSCGQFASNATVRITPTDDPTKFIVKVDGRLVGIHENGREAGKTLSHINSTKNWLVIEDGCGGDSAPKVKAYKIANGSMQKSSDLERIDKEHYYEYSQGRGNTDPFFSGFDESGNPLITSATGIHILEN